ncbi:flagellar motor switch protein FliG [Bacillus fungorum]|uniref:Flagellar motor switch protein FliG n=1 Tax=Bacillus fungorum TaxID=2039284 RepID=A0A2G6QGK3_9BACI|nr:flagellar motor switch protein FliG [Bacillus fungorum]PIE95972.1 flagellar motor switch protein FliG [Bacillus fungorum]
MNIFLCGSNQLTALDREEIKKFLSDYAHKHKIYILCYKSIENEVLRFFVENERFSQNLCLYTLQPLHLLTDEFQEVVDYLKTYGAQHIAFDHSYDSIYRSEYVFFVKQIVEDSNLVFCFYNGDKHTSVIPVDVAKDAGIDAVIYDLPGLHEKQMNKSFEQKIRIM